MAWVRAQNNMLKALSSENAAAWAVAVPRGAVVKKIAVSCKTEGLLSLEMEGHLVLDEFPMAASSVFVLDFPEGRHLGSFAWVEDELPVPAGVVMHCAVFLEN